MSTPAPACTLIAISGGSGSGKTTLAAALAGRLGAADCLVISEDDYYLGRPEDAPFDPDAFDFDHPSAKDLALLGEHLEALKRGDRVERPRYDLRTHRRLPDTVTVAPASFVIVEGIHVLGAPFADLFDLRVYVETPADIRLARRVLRDIARRGRPVEEVVHRYVTFVRPSHHAHTEPAQARAHVVVRDESGAIAQTEAEALAAMDALLGPVMERLGGGGQIPSAVR